MVDTYSEMLYFNSLGPSAPSPLRNQLLALPHDTLRTVDIFLRFVLGAPCPSDAPSALRSTWNSAQQEVSQRVAQLKESLVAPESDHESRKRGRDDELVTNPKRAKVSDNAAGNQSHLSDAAPSDSPLFTLHALSLTSPIRKKADISIHQHTLHLTNPSTHAHEHPPIALSAFRRAFLLPTRGKSKPHWTVVLMPSDVPSPGGKSSKDKGKAKEGETEVASPVVFGVDATPAAFSTTTYGADGTPQTIGHPKGTDALSSLRAFLSHLRIPALEPSTDVFRSALSGGGGGGTGQDVAGIEAYRGAKAGTLWFLSEGVLWDGRPAEFFALEDLAREGSAGEVEGIRTISATGRTCSVIMRRVEGRNGEESQPESDGEEEDEDDAEEARVVEVDFGMIDGKEQEGIARWVKRHRHLFGRRDVSQPPMASHSGSNGNKTGTEPGVSTSVEAKAAAKAQRNPAEEDTDDEEDEDFVDDLSSDGGSASSDSDSESGDGGSGDDEDDAEASDEEGSGKEEIEEEELNPVRHPLLRPGAMPRMSRAAIDAVVGMVEEDLMGVGNGRNKGRHGGERSERTESESGEEDELED